MFFRKLSIYFASTKTNINKYNSLSSLVKINNWENMQNQIFNYNGNNITFQIGNGDVMVNATEMAKNFGKSSKDYLRTQQSNELIEALAKRLKCPLADLLVVSKGGNDSGTWMHEDIALDFAQWLSVDFKLWCNDRIKELLKHGLTATPQTLEQMLDNPDVLITALTQLKQERAEKERLQFQNQKQQEALQLSAPKIEYYNEVLTSTSTYTTTLIAKELCLSAMVLNRKLNDLKIQFKQNDTWVLYSKYQNSGYTKTTTSTYTDSNGSTKSAMLTVWTEKGRLFIHELLKEKATA